MTEPWSYGPNLVGDRVYDVNGRRIGRVAGVHPETASFDVELNGRAARTLHARGRFVRIPFRDVVDADDHDVTLDEEARFLVHPELRVFEPV